MWNNINFSCNKSIIGNREENNSNKKEGECSDDMTNLLNDTADFDNCKFYNMIYFSNK